ncbi:MAG: co-chaperone GroES [Deltaproteobacteria bacterium]|nr:co-chaperone GroES [Deltaproteobacteria bacterium]
MKVRPLYDRIVIKRLEAETTTRAGIIIPGNAQEKPSQGEVIAVGNGKLSANGELRPLQVKVGDKVLFGKYSGNEIKLDGEELIIMREEDLLAIVEG